MQVTVDGKSLKAVCDRLEKLLAGDSAEAGEVLDANADMLNEAFPDHYRKIVDSIRSYDFDVALTELRSATVDKSISTM